MSHETLQWGRSTRAPENQHPERFQPLRRRRFNGAGARGLRKICDTRKTTYRYRELQWGRSTRAPENTTPNPTTDPPYPRFNGAGARGLRKIAIHACVAHHASEASMGPEHEGSGKCGDIAINFWATEASMGPEHEGSGKWDYAAIWLEVRGASMGPEHEGSGKSGFEFADIH